MSLIGQLPLAAIRLYSRNLEESTHFYRDVVGLKPIVVEDKKDPGVHFDLGNILLTIMPKAQAKENSDIKNASPDHLVFIVENAIENVQADLVKRGVKMRSKHIVQDSDGKMAWFADPDGHVIYLWQPPRRDSKKFRDVEGVVKHYESVSRALADLREVEET
jgi:catechol 2,3-dioxygenase-like lactoylglutathione lyase family enzyme